LPNQKEASRMRNEVSKSDYKVGTGNNSKAKGHKVGKHAGRSQSFERYKGRFKSSTMGFTAVHVVDCVDCRMLMS
jgi:hypothetical protein